MTRLCGIKYKGTTGKLCIFLLWTDDCLILGQKKHIKVEAEKFSKQFETTNGRQCGRVHRIQSIVECRLCQAYTTSEDLTIYLSGKKIFNYCSMVIPLDQVYKNISLVAGVNTENLEGEY